MTRGGATTATTYIRPYKQAAGLSAVQTMEERFAYGLNPQKLGAVSSHLCDPATAAAEFLLVKSEYQAATARPVERGALFFQIRQAFPPGEVTAEEANKLGFETAMRWTKGKYQLADIQRLRTIIGKRFYAVPYIDEKNGEEYYNMVME